MFLIYYMIDFDDFLTKIFAKILSRLFSQKNSLSSQQNFLKQDFYNISLWLQQLYKIVKV